MSLPTLPSKGSTSWYEWVQGVADEIGLPAGLSMADVNEGTNTITSALMPGTILRPVAASTDLSPLLQTILNGIRDQGGGKLTMPAGLYKFASSVTVPEGVCIEGEGLGTRLEYSGSGTFLTLKNEAKLTDLSINGLADTFNLIFLYNVFRTEIRSLTISGQHLPSQLKVGESGIAIRGNAGDSQIVNTRFNNLGRGILTDSIMDYVIGCVFSACGIGIYGDGNNFGSGISVSDTTFVSNAAATTAHVQVDGKANKWWFTNVWIEGCSKGVVIGNAQGGPYSFGMVNCAVASTANGIVVNNAKQTYLANISLENDGSATPVPLTIAKDGLAPDGIAMNIGIYNDFDVSPSVFPTNWTYIGRDKVKLPPNMIGDVDWAGSLKITAQNLTRPSLKVDAPLAINANIFEFGRAGEVSLSLDQYNNLIHRGTMYIGKNSSFSWNESGSSLINGTGAPTGRAGTAGDFYFRKDGGAGSRIYFCTAGGNPATWTPIV